MYGVCRSVLLVFVILMTVYSRRIPNRRRWNIKMFNRNLCEDYYCANGGKCISTVSYEQYGKWRSIPKCECTGSWRGQRCDENLCSDYTCNTGKCLIEADGSPSCCCPEGCMGKTCSDENNSTCSAANGECVETEKCDRNNTIDVPCCNGNVCCQKETCVKAEGPCADNDQFIGSCATECSTGLIDILSDTGMECCVGLQCCGSAKDTDGGGWGWTNIG